MPTTRRYHQPGLGWTDEPAGADVRIDSSVEEERSLRIHTRLFVRGAGGRWTALPDEQTLTGIQRGLVWQAWPSSAGLYGLRGIRPLDPALLVELAVDRLGFCDERGQPLPAGEPVGRDFFLHATDARRFVDAVQTAGGRVEQGEPLPAEADHLLQRLRAAVAQLEQIAKEDRVARRQLAAGEQAAFAAFEHRSQLFLEQYDRAATGWSELEQILRFWRTQQRGPNERAAAERLHQDGRLLRDRAVLLREERDQLASAHALAANEAVSESPSLFQLEFSRRLEAGLLSWRFEDGQLIIELPAGELRIGPTISYREHGDGPA